MSAVLGLAPGSIMRPMRLTDGIYKVDGMRVANVYLVVIEDGLLLVDSGMPVWALS